VNVFRGRTEEEDGWTFGLHLKCVQIILFSATFYYISEGYLYTRTHDALLEMNIATINHVSDKNESLHAHMKSLYSPTFDGSDFIMPLSDSYSQKHDLNLRRIQQLQLQ